MLGDTPKSDAEAARELTSGRVMLLTWLLTLLVLIPVAYVLLWLLALVGLESGDENRWERALTFACIGTAANVGVSLSQRFLVRR